MERALLVAATAIGVKIESCTACLSPLAIKDLIETPCRHRYCPDCLHTLFKRAMKDETLFPPACCGDKIPIGMASKHLPKRFIRHYKAKSLELKIRNKTYCHKPACSAFIAPHSIHNGHAHCQRCGSVTCGVCKSAWHYGRCTHADDLELFELAKTAAWKRCPECRRIVERNEGCDHMTYVVSRCTQDAVMLTQSSCRCGSEFCYSCGRSLDDCKCDSDDEDDQGTGFMLFD